jgi:hypothetical protein
MDGLKKKGEPGPGEYQLKDTNTVKLQAPKFGFGTASRDKGSFIKKTG